VFNAVKPVAAIRTYRVDLARVLEQQWRQGAPYSLTEYVRPTRPNGFEYECSNAGQSASVEPDWPIVIADTIDDGSIEWTCRDFGSNGTDLLSSVIVTAETGLTVDTYSVDGQAAQFTISGGTIGQVYDVSIKAVSDAGDEYKETVRITVIE